MKTNTEDNLKNENSKDINNESKEKQEGKSFFHFHEKMIVTLFIAAVFIIILFVNINTFGGLAKVSDEFCYLFQSEILGRGRIYVDSPPLPHYFIANNIISDGKWYSKYTIGWPLLLAPAKAFGVEFIVNPTLAALSLLMCYLISKKLFNRKSGLAALFFTAFSPIFIYMSASYFSHTSTGFFMLLLIYSVLKLEQDEKGFFTAAAAFSMMMSPMIRPGDGIVLAVAIIPLLVYTVLKSKNRKKMIMRCIFIATGFLAGIGILLFVNKIQNGDPFLFSFSKYDRSEMWGFGTSGHTPLKGLWNLAFSTMRNSFWMFPLSGVFAAAALFRKNIKTYLIAFIAAGYVAFYFGFYSLGVNGFGSRYYYPVFLILCIFASGGLDYVSVLLAKNRFFISEQGAENHRYLPVFVVMGAVLMTIGVFPQLNNYLKTNYRAFGSILTYLKSIPPETAAGGKAITFIREVPNRVTSVLTRNRVDYENDPNLCVLFLEPEQNEELIKKFPDRMPILVYYDF